MLQLLETGRKPPCFILSTLNCTVDYIDLQKIYNVITYMQRKRRAGVNEAAPSASLIVL